MSGIGFADHSRVELAALRDPLVVVPVGACEQHGPHLPTGTDTIVVTEVARRAADVLSAEFPVVVAPTLPVGFSRHHLPFGATITVSAATYQQFLTEMCESLLASGFRRLFIVNGHGGNSDIVNVVAREVALRHGTAVGAGSYWVMAWDELVRAGAHERNKLPGHAGAFETSVMLALRDGALRGDPPHRDDVAGSDPAGFHGPYLVEDQANWLRIDGYSDSPDRASAEDGSAWLEAAVAGVSGCLRRFYHHFGDTGTT